MERQFITDEELIMIGEIDEDNAFKEVELEDDDSDYEPDEKK